MPKIVPFIIGNERRFLELKGDFTELLKVTFCSGDHSQFTGWYIFERTNEKNRFVRKIRGSEVIDTFACATEYLQFDRNAGILLNSYNYNYEPIGSEHPVEYASLRERLSVVDEWR